MTISSLLHRRPDLSTFLVHFTRESGEANARDSLITILADGRLEARTEMGMARGMGITDPDQRVVCFTGTPLEHVWMMLEHIQGRAVVLRPYGVVFTKTWGRRRGVNPVWYVDTTPGHDWLTNPINEMVAAAIDGGAQEILRLSPFFEQMGTWNGGRKEFWWEREWRNVGDLAFHWRDLVAVFAPEAEHGGIHEALGPGNDADDLRLLDPEWGLERMIGALAGMVAQDVGPIPP